MSIHADNSTAEATLHKQRARSTVASLAISILVVALLMIVLALILLVPHLKETEVIIAYQGPASPDEQPQEIKKFSVPRPKPSAPSSAMARVIAANTSSPTAVPVPDLDVVTETNAFGSGDDFGDGWGSGDGDGWGGGTSFFQQKTSSRIVAYVIDYSLSMKSQQREKLMRDELKKSVANLSAGMHYQLIFFAGPAWVAGNKVTIAKGRKSATVSANKKTYKWTSAKGKANDWQPKGNRQVPEWIEAGSSNRNKSLAHIKNTKLVWGTHWEPALEMALKMDPPPQTIFFMTDGVTGGKVMDTVRSIARTAKKHRVVINTVAMMQPRAEAAMKELAKLTGGQFTIIEKGGKIRAATPRAKQ